MANLSCISKYEDEDTNANLILNNIRNDIITTNFDKTILNNKNIIIKEFDTTFIITTTKLQSSTSEPIIIFGQCENILKSFYNIDNRENLVIFFIRYKNIYNEINKLAYEVYYEINNHILIQLDLNLCNHIFNNNYIINCSNYSIESFLDDSCISCKESYYPMYDNTKTFVKCYKDLKGYFLDNNNYYRKCYESCEICDIGGDIYTHNCKKCAEGYIYKLNISSSLNCYKNCEYYFYYDEINYIYYCTSELKCPDKYQYLILEKKQCIDECYKDSEYQYEFQKKCYKECPNYKGHESKNTNYFCDSFCTKEMPFEIVNHKNCTNFCGINEMENKSCISKYKDDDTNANLILKNIRQDILTTNFDKTILNNKNIIIKEYKTTFTITTIKSSNFQIFNLEKCEKILKNYYNLNENKNLVILLINIEDKGINKSVFEIYDEIEENKLTKLDLDSCDDILSNNYIINCSNYSIESILEESCLSCKELYYPIYDNTSTFFKCYKNLLGYYLAPNNYLQKCYESCEICNTRGDFENHNCKKCASGYKFELNIFSYINCYKNCSYNYYYDNITDKYYCILEPNCPSKYKYLIEEKRQCIDQCSNDLEYKYEFRNKCYKKCPDIISQESKNKIFYCESICTKTKPFEIIKYQNCTNFCGINDMWNK